MRYKTLLLFGPPGSGKGTIGKLLATAGEFVHASSGDIFRSLSKDSPAGKLFYSYSSKGHLVPDEVTIEVFKEYITSLIQKGLFIPEKQWIILDGIPRTALQADIIQSLADIRIVCVLEANEQVLIQRLKKRALIENRFDDADEKVLENRMQVYKNQTTESLNRLDKNHIYTINADQNRLQVLRDVLQVVADKMI